jgi:hypothetical protein
MERFSLASIEPTLLEIDKWPEVDERTLADSKTRSLFERRRNAVRMLGRVHATGGLRR